MLRSKGKGLLPRTLRILLLVVSRLLVVVLARRVVLVAVVVDGGSYLRGFVMWRRHMDMGRKRK
jgi:hypothetical protein